MIDRRTFLKSAGAATVLWAARDVPAAADGSRVALVVGNAAYAQSPLANPINDATAVARLLRRASFAVDLRTDASREDFLDGIASFAGAVARSGTELGLVYFAGHGAQLAWKNYLLPVDADVASRDDLERRCVALDELLAPMRAATGKTFILILDACRNDPFASAWQADLPGLSQFDAPVGSLLAYATAPGRVASDGEGPNSLYTGHLLKELAAPQTSIEDAFKRVRLNVRLESKGEQIPWESTSLEESIYLFPGQARPSDAEIERQFEAELAAWSAVQGSRQAEDWVAYLRRYPTGRFSEIAQVRLNRLIAAHAPAPSDPVRTAAPAPAVASAPPVVAFQSGNPYSAGTFPLGRNYKLGDEIRYRFSDILTGIVERDEALVVTKVDKEADRVEFNQGLWVSDLNGNIQKMGPAEFDLPVQIFPAELQVGKRWRTRFRIPRRDFEYDVELRIRVRERVAVPAGEFDAFKIEAVGWGTERRRMVGTYWVVPGLNPFYVRRDLMIRHGDITVRHSQRQELVSYRQ